MSLTSNQFDHLDRLKKLKKLENLGNQEMVQISTRKTDKLSTAISKIIHLTLLEAN
jgi:hypothetical protein